MAIGARELSGSLDTFQVLFLRSVFGLLVISSLMIVTRQTRARFTTRLPLHCVRNVFHFAGQYGWFLGISILPLAEVFALEFTVPLWTALIAWLFLGERLTANKLVAIVLGLFGVMLIVKPGTQLFSYASFVVLAAAICYSVSHACTKGLASSESPITILFYMCVVQLPIGLVLAIPNWVTPQGEQWLWLSVVSVTALTAHYCMTKAMQHTEVTHVVVMDFLRLPIIGAVGVALYGEPLQLSLLVGAAIMLTGNVWQLMARNNESISRD